MSRPIVHLDREDPLGYFSTVQEHPYTAPRPLTNVEKGLVEEALKLGAQRPNAYKPYASFSKGVKP